MDHGHISYPMSPMRAIKAVLMTFVCWRCGKIGQRHLTPQQVLDDSYITICGDCVFKLTPTNKVEWFSEEWTGLARSGCDPIWSYEPPV
jgi:hypothetical protein